MTEFELKFSPALSGARGAHWVLYNEAGGVIDRGFAFTRWGCRYDARRAARRFLRSERDDWRRGSEVLKVSL